jgi:sulfur-carrier protein
LRDVLGLGREQVPSDYPQLSDLLALLHSRGEPWSTELAPNKAFKIALNHAVVEAGANPSLKAGDEIAFLPPVTGG